MTPTKVLTTMFSEDGKREAQVFRNDGGLFVNMFQRNDQEKLELIHKVDVSKHSECYAEDAAENWVMYIIRK